MRAWSAATVLGVLGLASAVFVVVRLIERWRVSPARASHQVELLGLRVSYPAANFAAGVVLVLGVIGVVVLALAVSGVIRELASARRLGGRMALSRVTSVEHALVFEDARPLAFCAGLLRPRVYISTGALAVLDGPALHAVLRHEQHHARCHDPLRLAVGRVLTRSLFFVPGITTLARDQQSLAELAADEWAVAAIPQNRAALAQAMLAFSDAEAPGMSVGIDAARVDQLLGLPHGWRFPTAVCIGSVILLVLTAAAVALISRLATGSASLALPLLSNRPCVVILGMVPAAIGLLALRRPARATAPLGPSD